eukprot:GHVT01020427.1.p1 GENE.GHVT01020427.1~~GHVT01020427.1.p1  ORF type:complete len:257 (+),score=47.94 GHVT01020427.1:166-936(+)
MMAEISAEVYGFVSWICSFAVFGIYLIWSLAPDAFLHSLGVTYYPQRYWALSIPNYCLVACFCIFLTYNALNFLVTQPLTSYNLVADEFSHSSIDFFYPHPRPGNFRYRVTAKNIVSTFPPLSSSSSSSVVASGNVFSSPPLSDASPQCHTDTSSAAFASNTTSNSSSTSSSLSLCKAPPSSSYISSEKNYELDSFSASFPPERATAIPEVSDIPLPLINLLLFAASPQLPDRDVTANSAVSSALVTPLPCSHFPC